MQTSEPNVAFLVYEPTRQRRADNSFDGNDNIGAKVIIDVLERAGINVGYCAPETAHSYDVVLVSLTSTYDVYAFYRAVAMRREWQMGARKFRVVAGGFGMQNPTVIRNYIDYAAFGRAEAFAADLVKTALDGGKFAHPSVMNLPAITPVKICQADALYPHAVEVVPGKTWTERFSGCPGKCRFCHFTWTRKKVGLDDIFLMDGLRDSGGYEMMMRDVRLVESKRGRVRTAIDGFSERLRFVYGKHISDDMIISAIEHLGQWGGTTTMLVYNIGNFPTETQDDREALYRALRRANPKGRVIWVLQTTPFRPSLATPMQWEPVALWPNFHDVAATVIDDRPDLRAIHSFSNESPYSQLQTVVAERATEETDKLFHAICFAPKLQSGNARDLIRRIEGNFDIEPYVKGYEIGDPNGPGWFLESWVGNEKTRESARAMRRKAAQ